MLLPPESDSEFEEIFGYIPTDEEAEEYIKYHCEIASMEELDMEEIVLESED